MGITLIDPNDEPEVWDYIELDGVRSPGPCGIPSSVFRRLKLEVQQSLGFTGGFLVFRGEDLPTLPYTMRLWSREHWQEGGAFYDMLIEGYRRRLNRVMRIDDPAITPLGFNRCVVEAIGSLVRKEDGSCLYTAQFELKHHKRRAPIQSLPRPADDPWKNAKAAEEEVKAAQAEYEKQYQAAQAAAAKGK